MSAFQKGDIVQILQTEHTGCVTTIEGPCMCFTSFVAMVATGGEQFYRLTGFPSECFHRSILKKLGGERPPEQTVETRDEPIEEPA